MVDNMDYSLASSQQIKESLCRRIEQIRISRNITQVRLAELAGVSEKTIKRLENGQGVSLDTFIRVLIALNLQENLNILLPDPTIRPIERVSNKGKERQRSRPGKTVEQADGWTWGDERE